MKKLLLLQWLLNKLPLILLLGLGFGVFSCNTSEKFPFKDLNEKSEALLKDKTQNYKTHKYGQFKLYFPADAFTKEEISAQEAELDRSMQKALRVTGTSAYLNGIHIFLFPDTAAMKAHTNSSLRYLIRPNEDAAYLVANSTQRPYFSHILFQILAVESWGTPKDGIMVEGGAFFTDFRCMDIDYPFDEIGSYLYTQDSLISLRAIMRNYREVYAIYPTQTEIESAAFFQFIYDNFGLEKAKRLWVEGIRRIEGVIGMTAGEVEKEIIGRFKNNADGQQIDWEKLKRDGC